MRDDVTIVIPTYRRHRLLAACLDVYADYPGPIIIADGSPEPYHAALPRGATYLHAPQHGILERMRLAVENVHTPYTVMRSDRRFTALSGILRCADFLDDHPDYVLAQGLWFWLIEAENRKRALKLLARRAGARLDVWQKRLRGARVGIGAERLARLKPDLIVKPSYCETCLRPVTAQGPLERVRASFSPYMPTFYAVTRSAAWREAVRAPFGSLGNLNMQELYTHTAMLLQGKAAILPVLYACVFPSAKKDKDMTVYASVTEDAQAIARDEDIFIEGIAALHGRLFGSAEQASREVAAACMEAYKGYFDWARGSGPRLTPEFPVRGHLEIMDVESFAGLQECLALCRRLLDGGELA